MKRIALIALSVLLVAALAACSINVTRGGTDVSRVTAVSAQDNGGDHADDGSRAPDPAGTVNVPEVKESSLTLDNAKIVVFTGDTGSGNKKHTFTSEAAGIYGLEFTGTSNDASYSFVIKDSSGKYVASNSLLYDWENYKTYFECKENEKYTLEIEKLSNTFYYTASIGYQKPTVDITEGPTKISDSFEFPGQTENFSFVPAIDGRYSFTCTEVRAGNELSMTILDHLGKYVDGRQYMSNGYTLSADLKAGESYLLTIGSNGNFTYDLIVCRPKPVVDFSVGDAVNDSIQFLAQKNEYRFTVPSDGNYVISFNAARSGDELTFRIVDHLDYYVYNGSNKYESTVEFKAGENYKLSVEQSSGLFGYCFSIKRAG
ncbi:MAG: hypothetical protein J5793_02465 [Clostridia bacterium]|nr:hypothetical protein [Clostridia bacterium]